MVRAFTSLSVRVAICLYHRDFLDLTDQLRTLDFPPCMKFLDQRQGEPSFCYQLLPSLKTRERVGPQGVEMTKGLFEHRGLPHDGLYQAPSHFPLVESPLRLAAQEMPIT